MIIELFTIPMSEIYFILMIFACLPLAVVHFICREIVRRYPGIMPDEQQRERFRDGELNMAFRSISMLLFMYLILDAMLVLCTTQPILGFIAHGPFIIFSYSTLYSKSYHLKRLLEQVKEL